MATIDELLAPFARSIYVKAETLKSVPMTSSQRARLLESMSDNIKKCTNFVEPEVSQAALNEAELLQVDLPTQNWHDQPLFDAGRGIFHFEHIVPVSAIRGECYEQDSESGTFEILRRRLRVAWILKSEDAELTRLGFRSNRLDPDAAYRKAGISLVSTKQPESATVDVPKTA